MARNLEQVLGKLPRKRREKIEHRAGELATLSWGFNPAIEFGCFLPVLRLSV